MDSACWSVHENNMNANIGKNKYCLRKITIIHLIIYNVCLITIQR
jgi:hypothetical protein